nr:reverse transcriptase domain-containing protein [Tanacetum cinerariifolium]
MGEHHRKSYSPPIRKEDRPFRNNYMGDARKGEYHAWIALVLTMDSLTKPPKELLATETQLRLAPPRPMLNLQKGGNMDRGEEKIKGGGSLTGQKKSARSNERVDEFSHHFPPASTEYVLDETLIVEVEVEGYLVRRIYVDGGASIEVMFEHCFENLSLAIKARLREIQTELVGFAREAMKLLGKIELEVCFGSEGLCRRTTMKFTIIWAPSPYNIILGRTGIRNLRPYHPPSIQ